MAREREDGSGRQLSWPDRRLLHSLARPERADATPISQQAPAMPGGRRRRSSWPYQSIWQPSKRSRWQWQLGRTPEKSGGRGRYQVAEAELRSAYRHRRRRRTYQQNSARHQEATSIVLE